MTTREKARVARGGNSSSLFPHALAKYLGFQPDGVRDRDEDFRDPRLLSLLLTTMSDGLIAVDHKDRVRWLTPKAAAIMETDEEAVLGRSARQFLAEVPIVDVNEIMPTEVIRKQRHIKIEHRQLETQRNRNLAAVYLLSDRTETRLLHATQQHYATHDSLTGLATRPLLSRYLEEKRSDPKEDGDSFALLMIDIDHFHLVNETFGHQRGDSVLRRLSKRLEALCSEADLLVRFSNDVFIIVSEDAGNRMQAEELAQQVLAAIRVPLQIASESILVTASIGISIWPEHSPDATGLIAYADLALKQLRHRDDEYLFFAPEFEATAKRERLVRQELRSALQQGEFTLFFQPQVALATGQVNGFEALIRWQRGTNDLIPPSFFIPIAESAGLIENITDWVARNAIAQSLGWQQAGLGPLGMSINVSARHFIHANLAEDLGRVLSDSNAPQVELTVELTESMLMSEPRRAIAILERLKSMGIKIAIDDFGTGYSSLSYLKNFPIDCLKIDRSFIMEIGKDNRQDEIVVAIALLAQSLGISIVAEGVETEEQADFLNSLGCHSAQGYFYSRPVPAHSIPDLLTGLNKRSVDTHKLH